MPWKRLKASYVLWMPLPLSGLFVCRLFYMQLVTPRVVATAVRMLMITCISVFQVSFFIMIFLSF